MVGTEVRPADYRDLWSNCRRRQCGCRDRVFSILVTINFVVITKGAGRIAEVAARFTLDALPGKQMAIDAELNAGIIDEDAAKARRLEIAREADFYGAMDGASKFIRGDAIAGILITLINIIGGILIGVVQHGMPFEISADLYSADHWRWFGGQLPALVISGAAGLLVTRVPSKDGDENSELHNLLASQLFSRQDRYLPLHLTHSVFNDTWASASVPCASSNNSRCGLL